MSEEDCEMILAGIDVGLEYMKAVILQNGKMIGKAIGLSGSAARSQYVEKVFDQALTTANLTTSDVEKIIATGKGKFDVSFADKSVTEPYAAVLAARYFDPKATMVISIGADETTVSAIAEDGKIGEFTINQKCAAGLGIFLETIAHRLEMEIEKFGMLQGGYSERANDGCVVFGELDVLSQINRGIPYEQAALSAVDAAALRASTTLNDITIPNKEKMVLIGGVAKNRAFVRALEKRTGNVFMVPDEPEYAGAIGAALSAT
jgi:predicted CoA-substrate-specific enzyme activase